MIFIGIASGVVSALLQGGAYFFSRNFMVRHENPVKLMIASQLLLGAAALLLAPFVVTFEAFKPAVIAPLLSCSVFFIAAQICFFRALRRIESSRIGSIIGLKVVMVPLLLFLFFGATFNIGQMAALAVATGTIFLMNYSGGGRFNWDGMGFCLLSLLFYSGGDISIKILIDAIALESIVHSAAIGAVFCYALTGILVLPLAHTLKPVMYRDAAFYALFWGVGSVAFFACFGLLGPVFGNVVQSLRGLFSLGIGFVLAYMGYRHLEEKVPARVWWRRAAAATLMIGAIVIYTLSTV